MTVLISCIVTIPISLGAQAPTKDTKRKDSVDTLDQQSKSVTVGSNAELVEGQGLLIHCPLVGKPAPKVDWFFNKKPLSDKRKDVVIAENGKSLFILEAGKQATGRYTCKGSNILGTHTESTNLKILGRCH